MKKTLINSLAACLALGFVLNVSAQTIFTADGGDLNTAGNWAGGTTGLPVGQDGEISLDATQSATMTNYQVTQLAGTVSLLPNTNTFLGGSWNVEGGTLLMAGGGTADIQTGSAHTLTVDGGLLSITGDDFRLGGAGSAAAFNVASGTVSISDELAIINNSTAQFLGGATTFNRLRHNAGSAITLSSGIGGSVIGTSITTFAGTMDWQTDSLMTWSFSGETDWAETQWNAGRITFNTQGVGDLGVWSAVNGSVFDFDTGTNTLSLVPEPSTFALLAGALAMGLAMVRRRRS